MYRLKLYHKIKRENKIEISLQFHGTGRILNLQTWLIAVLSQLALMLS